MLEVFNAGTRSALVLFVSVPALGGCWSLSLEAGSSVVTSHYAGARLVNEILLVGQVEFLAVAKEAGRTARMDKEGRLVLLCATDMVEAGRHRLSCVNGVQQ